MTRLKKIRNARKDAPQTDYTNYFIGGLVVILLIVLYFNFIGKAPAPPVNFDIEDDDPFQGPKEAKVALVEFSDFQCPACKSAEPTVKKIMAEYKDKVRLVYRDFPLDQGCNSLLASQIHPFACRASFAADCANEQGKFWPYHDILFEKQPALEDASLKQYAVDLGLDAGKFNACLDSLKYLDEVKKDIADGESLAVNATPTFFVNGKKLSGRAYEEMKAAIDEALAATEKPVSS